MHIMELAYEADFAIVKAWKGDEAETWYLKELRVTLMPAWLALERSRSQRWKNFYPVR
jgi:hypothetical protein